MFTTAALHAIRQHEITFFSRLLPLGGRVLEVGAGTGYQARELVRQGFHVSAIDLSTSVHKAARLFEVIDYDGVHIPFPDASFDAVFSSNVLEHVDNLDALLVEMARVLKPDGIGVHATPTPTWRFWTTIAGPIDAMIFLADQAVRVDRSPPLKILRNVLSRIAPRKHGTSGNAFTEIWTYRRAAWRQKFSRSRYIVIDQLPMGVFYTGWMLLGAKWSLRSRERAARYLGSSCCVQVVRPLRILT